jgi:ATP-dependent protease ClpP protease subunit
MNDFAPMSTNLLEAYKSDDSIRDRMNKQGIYVTFADNTSMSFYLTSEVEDASAYHDFVELSVLLQDDDNLNVLIDSPGGYLSGANMIITGLNSTKARTTAIVTDMAASAATIIALACDELVMTEYSHFMIHAVAFGSGGKLHEVASHTEFTIKKSRDLITNVYKDFLTPEEIQQVIDGKDIYLDEDDTMLRWEMVLEARNATIAEREAEHIKEHIEMLKANLAMLEGKLPKEKPKSKAKPKA